MPSSFLVYHHKNLALAEYVIAYASLSEFGEVTTFSLPQQATHPPFAELPPALRRLLFFARPDVVICLDDGSRPVRPIFAFELTNHVPAQDHWMQRFVNLVGCAQESVPGAYVMPFAMREHPSFRSELDEVFFYAYDRVTEIHQTPIFIAEWEVPDGRTVLCDPNYASLPDHRSPDLNTAFQFLAAVIEASIHGRDLSQLMKERLIVRLRDRIRQRAYASIPQISQFRRLAINHPDGVPLNSSQFSDWLAKRDLKIPENLPDRMNKRNQFLIYTPQVQAGRKSRVDLRAQLMARIDKKGGDPYLGQPLVFDYLFCRLGQTPYERDINLVVDLTVLNFGDLAKFHVKLWENSPLQFTQLSKIKHIPTYTMYLKEGSSQVLKNFLRLYSFAADIIVFHDGVIYF